MFSQCRLWPMMALLAGAVPQLIVDLDEAPETRWRHVVKYYFDTGLAAAMAKHNAETNPLPAQDAPKWLEALKATLDDEQRREMQGYADIANSIDPTAGVTLDAMLLAQHDYELNYPVYCAGMMAAMQNGTVLHARNMDYPLTIFYNGQVIGWPDMTIEVLFMRDGKPLITSVTWPMQVGFHTAMRFDGWTFEQNTRRHNPGMSEQHTNLAAAQKGGVGFGLTVRKIMEATPDFKTAVDKIWSHTNFMAQHYFVMTGAKPYEGAVLSIDRMGQHLPFTPRLLELDSTAHKWHLVQTNDDNHGEISFNIDQRRPSEDARLRSTSQAQVGPAWALNEMHHGPLYSPLGTVFTWIAIPATGYHKIFLPGEDTLDAGKKSWTFLNKRPH